MVYKASGLQALCSIWQTVCKACKCPESVQKCPEDVLQGLQTVCNMVYKACQLFAIWFTRLVNLLPCKPLALQTVSYNKMPILQAVKVRLNITPQVRT